MALLTSFDEQELADLWYRVPVSELVELGVSKAM